MTLLDALLLLPIAGFSGLLGRVLGGEEKGGSLPSVAVGLLGAVLALWTARALPLPILFPVSVDGATFPAFWAVIGSAAFVWVLTRVRRGRSSGGARAPESGQDDD